MAPATAAALPELPTSAETCEKLKISPRTLQDLTKRELIPAVRMGPRTVRYSAEALAEWIKEKQSKSGK